MNEQRLGPTEEDKKRWSEEAAGAMGKIVDEAVARKKFVHIGAPACFALELAAQQLCQAFNSFGVYVVGSALERPNWRDIDLRMIMADEDFAKEFPDAGDNWEFDAKWLLLTVAISEHLKKLTGLPIDFQFQSQTHANARHKGPRNAVGLKIAKP